MEKKFKNKLKILQSPKKILIWYNGYLVFNLKNLSKKQSRLITNCVYSYYWIMSILIKCGCMGKKLIKFFNF